MGFKVDDYVSITTFNARGTVTELLPYARVATDFGEFIVPVTELEHAEKPPEEPPFGSIVRFNKSAYRFLHTPDGWLASHETDTTFEGGRFRSWSSLYDDYHTTYVVV